MSIENDTRYTLTKLVSDLQIIYGNKGKRNLNNFLIVMPHIIDVAHPQNVR